MSSIKFAIRQLFKHLTFAGAAVLTLAMLSWQTPWHSQRFTLRCCVSFPRSRLLGLDISKIERRIIGLASPQCVSQPTFRRVCDEGQSGVTRTRVGKRRPFILRRTFRKP
ncbi:MAG: hypothetical protein M2R45_03239 [Verrucomicrobia subdivision 3 bacterium]|nr:hypothetical protein [Limisphaerales bacterium]MCS1416100.1 hypothetical protein [Limisphaerales bacterium]